MTDAPRPTARGAIAALVRRPLVLWVAFVAVHFWIGLADLYAPGLPLGDVTLVYKFWVEHGLVSHQWVGLDTSWVYPIVALVPMIISYNFGPEYYGSTWLALVMIVDAGAFAVIMAFGRDRRVVHVAWWWLAMLSCLGPIALARIDSITVPVAIVGMLCVATAPRLAGALLAVATWIKVWPAALIAAIVIAAANRVKFLVGVLLASAVIVIAAVALGGGSQLFSFVSQQAGRGLQVESVIATPWMWAAYADGAVSYIRYDTTILTYEIHGPGVTMAAGIATPLMVMVVAGLLGLSALAARRRIPAPELLPPLLLAITTALILFNKVGSPQFATWLAVPIVFGLSTAATGRGMSFRTPAVLGLLIGAATQAFYPYVYVQLLDLNPTLLVVLSVRNLLYIVLFGWAVAAVVHLIRHGSVLPIERGTDWLPRVWPFGPMTQPHDT
jgi:hypothetical protein